MEKKAIVVGVGPEAGLGGALCQRLAREGLHVFVAGRTPAKVEALVVAIRNAGTHATGVPMDTTREQDVIALFAQAMGEDGLISLAGLSDAYWYLYNQPKAAWTHELDLRPFKESF